MAKFEIEKKQYDFLSPEFNKNKSLIYRLNVNGTRYYYEIINNDPVIYASGTTIISDGYPETNKGMEKWRVQMLVMGKDPDEYAAYRAAYGTIMHILFGHYLMKKQIPFDKLEDYIKKLENTGISDRVVDKIIEDNIDELRKDLLAFATWVKDYNVKPLAIEMMMASRKYQVATAIDLICELDLTEKGNFGEVYKSGKQKGQPKESKRTRRILAIVDFKSGKKGFYNKHALQLLLNKEIVKETFPDVNIEKIYNLSPKEWKTKPSYNFKDQTNNPVLDELYDVLSLGKKRHIKKEKYVKIYEGSLKFGTEFDINEIYKVIPLKEYIKELHKL